jgi:hypothetical protein
MGATAPSASAADFDQRVQSENNIQCLGDTFGLTPSVRIWQPWVRGNLKTWEAIYWVPFLQRWDPSHRTWVYPPPSAGWYSFWAKSDGPSYETYYNQPKQHLFEGLTRGYFYRVVHLVFWSSSMEFGTKPSDYQYTSGYCWL